MKITQLTFNLYLAAGLLMCIPDAHLLGAEQKKDATSTKKKKKEVATIRLFVETNFTDKDHTQEVPVGRSGAVRIMINKAEFIHEGYLSKAEIVPIMDDLFSIKLHFDQRGTWLLENVSSLNLGRRMAIFSQFGKTGRWLAAPVIDRRIVDGTVTFAADVSREEAEEIVRGLNYAVEQARKHE